MTEHPETWDEAVQNRDNKMGPYEIPEPEVCKCGHRVTWYEPDPDPDRSSVFYEIAEDLGMPHMRRMEDVVERDCPHRNGTVIQHCPKCDQKVGMWGCAVAGGMECDCWGKRPWWRRLLDLVIHS